MRGVASGLLAGDARNAAESRNRTPRVGRRRGSTRAFGPNLGLQRVRGATAWRSGMRPSSHAQRAEADVPPRTVRGSGFDARGSAGTDAKSGRRDPRVSGNGWPERSSVPEGLRERMAGAVGETRGSARTDARSGWRDPRVCENGCPERSRRPEGLRERMPGAVGETRGSSGTDARSGWRDPRVFGNGSQIHRLMP